MRQSKVDKLYAGLKDLAEERRGKLDERHRLFQLNREVDDLEQWIAEREVVAGSHELGQDYEHVTASTGGKWVVVWKAFLGCEVMGVVSAWCFPWVSLSFVMGRHSSSQTDNSGTADLWFSGLEYQLVPPT